MAATLFIIKIPNEQKEEELKDNEKENGVIPYQEEEVDEENREERKASPTNISAPAPDLQIIAEDPDLETDTQRVVFADDEACFKHFRVPSSTNITETNDDINDGVKSKNEDVHTPSASEGDNMKYADDEEELQPLNPTSSELINNSITSITSEHLNEDEQNKNPATDENVQEVENLAGVETLEPKSPEVGVKMLDFIPKESLQTRLQSVLESMAITNISWSDVEGYKQAFFIDCGDPNRVEDILDNIMFLGIGQKIGGTSVSLFPATVHIENVDTNKDDESLFNLQKEKESKFKKSVKSRMIVAQVVEIVRSNALFTFDYCMLIILASMISVVGLIENSSVVLVASMLISPLMGPILAGTFGITIENSSLRNLGIRSECIGLCMCLICGFVCGLVMGGIQLQGLTGYIDEWPTMEMKSRGLSRSLLVGVFIALPSGAAVSLSVLGGNTGSLVGVAISASLLPPAVNAGMLWAFALLTTITPPENVPIHNSSSEVNRGELGCLPFLDNDYEPVYSCNMAKEMGIMGAISLLLTLINILCIFLVGVFMLKIKEVVPQTSSLNTSEFWGSDLKVARDSYKTMKGSESVNLHQKFRNEWEKIRKSEEREGSVRRRKDNNFERILKGISTSLPYNPYWTLPYQPPPSDDDDDDDDQAPHTIHNIHHSKWFHYETTVASPGIRLARPFSFPNYVEETPTKTPKPKQHKKIRFNLPAPKKTKSKFTVTSVRESSLLKTNIDNEMV